jgi:hypothetical protein
MELQNHASRATAFIASYPAVKLLPEGCKSQLEVLMREATVLHEDNHNWHTWELGMRGKIAEVLANFPHYRDGIIYLLDDVVVGAARGLLGKHLLGPDNEYEGYAESHPLRAAESVPSKWMSLYEKRRAQLRALIHLYEVLMRPDNPPPPPRFRGLDLIMPQGWLAWENPDWFGLHHYWHPDSTAAHIPLTVEARAIIPSPLPSCRGRKKTHQDDRDDSVMLDEFLVGISTDECDTIARSVGFHPIDRAPNHTINNNARHLLVTKFAPAKLNAIVDALFEKVCLKSGVVTSFYRAIAKRYGHQVPEDFEREQRNSSPYLEAKAKADTALAAIL